MPRWLSRRLRFRLVSAIFTLIILAALTFTLTQKEMARAQDTPKPIRALLVVGGGSHDYSKQKDVVAKGIAARAHVEVVISLFASNQLYNPIYDNPDWSAGFDVVIHDGCADTKDLTVVNRILEPHRRGLPAVIVHCGVHSHRTKGWPKATPWFEFTGLPSTGHGPGAAINVTYTDKDSPITKGLANWTTTPDEELYNNSAGKLLDTARPLARGVQGKGDVPGQNDCVVAWTNMYMGTTKVFGTTLGHHTKAVADPRYLDLVTRGLLWSVDKLNDTYLKKQP